MNQDKLTAAQISRRYQVSPLTVRLWCKKGLLPNARLEQLPYGGQIWLIPESDLTNFTIPKMGRPAKEKPLPVTGDPSQTTSVRNFEEKFIPELLDEHQHGQQHSPVSPAEETDFLEEFMRKFVWNKPSDS